ncbi:helix-turn-helix domain-containing protein [Mycobacteroides abscessus subsp. bolletii]|uniref:helix-turn-helix domain-containing protein n=1 Tax=Mycobacteroides abscessus TaxID=36809 RepID=UPI0019D18099|nr:helix-turn-helix domain-containing protein [Mycobacteroides abscessus]MBN7300444.1 helix-turn-helix domain-containing protein [Mycobacteroides abscessus subsp. bolletii]
MMHAHFRAPQPQNPLMWNKFRSAGGSVRSRAVQCVAQEFSAGAPIHCLVAASRVAQCGSVRSGAFCAASMAGRLSSSEMKGHEMTEVHDFTDSDPGRGYSISKVAAHTSLSRRTIEYALAKGELVGYRKGRRVVIFERDLTRWLLLHFEPTTVTASFTSQGKAAVEAGVRADEITAAQ